MAREKVYFENAGGQRLAAVLEMPDKPVRAYALFAHCFTCGKDIAAAARIARGLVAGGIGVLRFDFMGLGESEGEFADSSFSSNVSDLVSAAGFLRQRDRGPGLLVGHSLGGTAALYAAGGIPEVEGVVTIGAPASPEHVIRLFGLDVAEIERVGEAEVTLAGRAFRIRKQFLEDLQGRRLEEVVGRWKRSLLVMHAPLDDIVPIGEAAEIFQAARHPKSFVAIDGADHLLSNIVKAQYVANVIAAWAGNFLPDLEEEAPKKVPGGSVWVGEGNRKFLRDVYTDDHHWLADEPRRVGGDNLGPDPYEHLLAALGTCTSMTIRMYANRKSWPLEDVDVHLTHSREYVDDCSDCAEGKGAQMAVLRRTIRLQGALNESQRARLLEIADRCPVHRTLAGPIRVETRLA